MNLMINNYCNLKCSYCFAQEEMNSHKAINITMENFCIYLDWLKEQDYKQVRLIGGEPTLHPNLEGLIDKVLEYGCFDDIMIFSNFTFKPEVAHMLAEKSQVIRLHFLPNINHFDTIFPIFRDRILYNLDLLTAVNPELQNIGINIYDPNQDMSFWEELICRYDIRKVRWSITVPNMELAEDFDFYKYFHSFQNVIDIMVDWCVKYGIKLECDCNGIPPCCFDAEKVVKWIKVDPEILGPIQCEEAVVDVSPELIARGCFGCNPTVTKHLTEFKTHKEMLDFFEENRQDRKQLIARKECLNCERYQVNKNSCSCYAYRKKGE